LGKIDAGREPMILNPLEIGRLMALFREISNYKVKMATAIIFILILVVLVGTVLWTYAGAFFASVFIYILLKPVYQNLRKRKLDKTPAALGALLFGLIVIGVPVVIVFWLLLAQTTGLITHGDMLNQTNIAQGIQTLIQTTGADNILRNPDAINTLKTETAQLIAGVVTYFKDALFSMAENMGHMTLGLLIVIFLPFYLLVWEERLVREGRTLIPFSPANRNILIKEFKNVTYSVLVCTGFMALLQAVALTLVLIYFQVPGALFLGFIGLVLSCIPFVGVPVVWIPVAIAEALNHNMEAAIGITAAGILIAVVENARPIFQKRIGQIHPLISILGVIVGVQYFGLLGVLVGPILFSYMILTISMFREEYAK